LYFGISYSTALETADTEFVTLIVEAVEVATTVGEGKVTAAAMGVVADPTEAAAADVVSLELVAELVVVLSCIG
jgi:hypothetical protein